MRAVGPLANHFCLQHLHRCYYARGRIISWEPPLTDVLAPLNPQHLKVVEEWPGHHPSAAITRILVLFTRALLLCLPLLRAFFHLEPMASVGVRSSEASAPDFYCVLTQACEDTAEKSAFFCFIPLKPVSIPSSHGLVNLAKMTIISEVDKSTISGHCEVVVNFSWWSMSTLMFHSELDWLLRCCLTAPVVPQRFQQACHCSLGAKKDMLPWIQPHLVLFIAQAD